MAILNYTTSIAVEKTASEIQQKLAKAKASAILTEYHDGVLDAVSFRIESSRGLLTFRLPANIQKIYQVIARDNRIPRGLKTREQAARVAWRIMKDWLEAQLAIIEAGMVDIEQVFLPYMQVNLQGQTLYEALQARNFTCAGLIESGQKTNVVQIRDARTA